MTCQFGTLPLDEIGIVGDPDIQYAAFEAELSEPKGYDGAVLANFKRGPTYIRFDLTLTGTESQKQHNLVQLIVALSGGMDELTLPGMTPGYVFEACANGPIQPRQYIGDMTIPLEFVVPNGLAVLRQEVEFDNPTWTGYWYQYDDYQPGWSNNQFKQVSWHLETEPISAIKSGNTWSLDSSIVVENSEGPLFNYGAIARSDVADEQFAAKIVIDSDENEAVRKFDPSAPVGLRRGSGEWFESENIIPFIPGKYMRVAYKGTGDPPVVKLSVYSEAVW